MLIIIIRTVITFLITFGLIRFMGKRQIGEMQPFEFVITLVIADLACIPMSDVSIPLTYGIVAILSIFIIHQFFALIEKKSIIFSRIISSKPSIVIDSNGINFDVLNSLNIGIDELQENLRNAGYSNFDQIEYALIETNGKFSILKKQQDPNETPPPKTPLPVCIIDKGKFVKWELERLEIDKEFIKRELEKDGVKDIKDIMVATIDNNGKIYYQCKEQKYKILMTDISGGRAW